MKKKSIKTRDFLMEKLINGATKSGVHTDHKKEENKYSGRSKEKRLKCKQCSFPIFDVDAGDEFCCDSCAEYYMEQHGNDDE